MELTKNEGSAAAWDVRHFADVSTSSVKVEVSAIYTSAGSNGFKEIQFYHDNCNRGLFLF